LRRAFTFCAFGLGALGLNRSARRAEKNAHEAERRSRPNAT
jgi:hypothetical protein